MLHMPVAPQIYAVEQEIDKRIAQLPYWLAPRDLLLERLLNY